MAPASLDGEETLTAMAARSFGYRIQVMDPDPSCPAIVDACFEGAWD